MLFQPLPGIPDGVKSEGTLAVLFMILLGVAVLAYVLRQLPAIIAAWKKAGAREEETAAIAASIDRAAVATAKMTAQLVELQVAIERQVGAHQAEAEEGRAVRFNIHKLLTPSIAGLTIAYLKLAGYHDMADRVARDNPGAIVP